MKIQKPRFKSVLFTAAAAAMLESSREKHKFRLTNYTISSDSLEDLSRDLRIVLLADLHDHSFGKNNIRLLNAILGIDPDLVLIAGDMVTADGVHNHTATEIFLRRLVERYPVYYALGNHESRLLHYPSRYRLFDGRAYLRRLRKSGVVILANRTETIRMQGVLLAISGLVMPERVYAHSLRHVGMTKLDIEERLGQPEPDAYRILIAHSPMEAEACAEWGADLTVSGHLHGGVMCLHGHIGLVTPQLRFFYPKARGSFPNEKGRLIVSGGLGSHLVPFRISNTPEIVVIRLKRGKKHTNGKGRA